MTGQKRYSSMNPRATDSHRGRGDVGTSPPRLGLDRGDRKGKEKGLGRLTRMQCEQKRGCGYGGDNQILLSLSL